jgi:hypothetical protein
VDGGSHGPRGVHDRADVVHPGLKGGHARDSIGHASSSLVKDNHPTKRREPLEFHPEYGDPPIELDVRGGAGDHDDIEWHVAHYLVGDAYVAAQCVAGLRHVHRQECPLRGHAAQRVEEFRDAATPKSPLRALENPSASQVALALRPEVL